MNLSLSPEILKLIDSRIRSGNYGTPEEVIAAAITNLDQQERITQSDGAELEALFPGIREKLAEGLAAARAGDVVDGEEFFDQLEREEDELTKGRKSA
jgi:Arc/MetJ-type ribon-helix-helix transcriptional regulator